MSAFVSAQWEIREKDPKQYKSVEEYLTAQSFTNSAGANVPALIFFTTSHAEKIPGKNKSKPTAQAELCEKINNETLNCCDFKLQIATRYFKCIKIQLSDVDKSADPVLNSDNAPIIAIIDRNKKAIAVLTGSQISSQTIIESMQKALKTANIDISETIAKATPKLKELQELRKKLSQLTAVQGTSNKIEALRTQIDKLEKETTAILPAANCN